MRLQETKHFLFFLRENKEKSMHIGKRDKAASTAANTKRDKKINTNVKSQQNKNKWNFTEINISIRYSENDLQVYSQWECNNVNSFLFMPLKIRFVKVVSNYHSVIFNSEYVCVETIDRPNVTSETFDKDVDVPRYSMSYKLDIFVDM